MKVLKPMALISVLFLVSACSVSLRSETKKNDHDTIVDKEFFIGPKIGKE